MPGDIADVVIVGGGIIGCTVALELASKQRYPSILLLEKSPYLGDGMSTRNSHVIHAGIYYPPGSMKARFCVEGNRLTYEFCEKHNIACSNTGKLVPPRRRRYQSSKSFGGTARSAVLPL
jgi:L-2-hydroxyglutarate oxidase LhgO